ncbi:cytochrome P450 [Cubamyces sp. BRFM 1775]|nr:cytochrome P450 [Cubamyces sp. BRFM 1775]
MQDLLNVVFTCLTALVGVLVVKWLTHPLRALPTVGGPSFPLLSYRGAFNWMRYGKAMVEEGYAKYYGSAFKVAMFDQWLVIISGPKLVEDVRRRPDDELSFVDGATEFVPLWHALGPEFHEDHYHLDIIRDKLTRSLASLLPDLIDELTVAVPEYIPAKVHEWVSVDIAAHAREIVARVSNRAFVGKPTCRNRRYLDLAIGFATDINKDKTIINLFPVSVKTFIGHFVSYAKTNVQHAMPLLKPIISERRRLIEQDSSEKPHDMLQWITETAVAKGHGDQSIVERVMVMNFAAIHTSSTSITQALYHLAEQPQYLQPLRDEIEPIVSEEGWTKAALGKMWKVDSVMREAQRLNGINTISVMRKARKNVVLSDGTHIPQGTLLVAAAMPMHHDEDLYDNAHVFDPFRFARQREGEGQGTRFQYVNTSADYVAFGHGKHACPGRFFAATELKAMLAYIVLNYDIKFDGDGQRPGNVYWGPIVFPAPSARVLFRKRQTSA